MSVLRMTSPTDGYTIISDEILANPKEMFDGKCDRVRFVKMSIASNDVSGGQSIIDKLDSALNTHSKVTNSYYYSLLICYGIVKADGKERDILDKKIFFNLNDNGQLSPLPEGCPVPIPPMAEFVPKDECKMGYKLGKIVN